MKTIKAISENPSIKGANKQILKIIAAKNSGVRDSLQAHSISEITQIKGFLEDQVKSNLSNNGGYRSIEDVCKQSHFDVNKLVSQFKEKKGVGDAYYNDLFGVGTGIDPTTASTSYLPINISPYEGASLYANGGLPQVIINKKAKGVLMNGFDFEGLDPDSAKKLKEHCLNKGLDQNLPLMEALVYGGAVMYPVFKKEGNKLSTYLMSLKELVKSGILEQNSIDHWVTADRWNVVVVPNYNITAEDYLNPESIYIPFGAMRVNTERCALLKPNKLPFWAAISQLGWSTSDYSGYIKEIYDLRITMMTFPILFQQMSLLFQLLPLDATLLTNGPGHATEIADYNAQKLREASILKPMALNAIGDIKSIDRSFQGAQPLLLAMRQNLCANADIPESVIFDTLPTGFSDNKEAITLKQSESVKKIDVSITPQLKNIVKILVIDCFGLESKEALSDVRLTFNPAVVLSENEKADKGLKCAQYIQALVGSGMKLDIAVKSAKQYFGFEIDAGDMSDIEEPDQTLSGKDVDLKGLIEQ